MLYFFCSSFIISRSSLLLILMLAFVSIAQGIYYLLTGVWPLVSIETFQKVTGRKTDLWLVKTVGVIVAVIGASLIYAGAKGEITPAIVIVAIGSALGLAGIDILYVGKRVIAPIYLLDALAEVLLIFGWAVGLIVNR